MPSGSEVLWGTFCKRQGVRASEPGRRARETDGPPQEKTGRMPTSRMREKERETGNVLESETQRIKRKIFKERETKRRHHEEMGALGWVGSTQKPAPKHFTAHPNTPFLL